MPESPQTIAEIPEIRAQCDKYYADKQQTLLTRVLNKINKILIGGGQESKSATSPDLLAYFHNAPIRAQSPFSYHLDNSELLTHHAQPLESYSPSDLALIAHNLQHLLCPRVFFSVVIPAHNRAHSIMECIDSVLRQSFTDYEIIIVDDASNDDTGKLIAQLQNPKITYYKFTQNQGAQTARNTGIYLAKGKWIAFLDSDDIWHENTLKTHYENILSHAPASNLFLYSACMVSNEITKQTHYWDLAPQDSGFLKAPAPMFQGMVAAKLSLLQIGMLDESTPSYQEWDTSISLARICQIIYTKEALFTYRLHTGDQISKNHQRDVAGYLYVVQKHKHEITQASTLWWNLHVLTILQKCKMFSIAPDPALWQELDTSNLARMIIKALLAFRPTKVPNKLARIALSCDYYFHKSKK